MKGRESISAKLACCLVANYAQLRLPGEECGTIFPATFEQKAPTDIKARMDDHAVSGLPLFSPSQRHAELL
jgi:hypothetical protein